MPFDKTSHDASSFGTGAVLAAVFQTRKGCPMERRQFLRSGAVATGVFALGDGGRIARSSAQMSGFVAKPMLQSPVESDESKEAVMLAISIAPGGSSGRHTHPGDCYGSGVEGTVELRIEGRQARRVPARWCCHNPRGVINDIRNIGDTPIRAVNTRVV